MRVSQRTWDVINPNVSEGGPRLSDLFPQKPGEDGIVVFQRMDEDGIGLPCGSCDIFHLYDEYPDDDTRCPSCGLPYDGSVEW